jgi:hypothetical protein
MAPSLPIEFAFTEEEREAACKEAFRRQTINEIRGLKGRNGGAATGAIALTIHLLGAAGEMAVASHLGLKEFLYKETEAKRGSCDLPGIDVKTRSRHSYDLIVQKNAGPEKKYVLVTIEDKKRWWWHRHYPHHHHHHYHHHHHHHHYQHHHHYLRLLLCSLLPISLCLLLSLSLGHQRIC